jgi:pyridoxine 5-phosphate synthase
MLSPTAMPRKRKPSSSGSPMARPSAASLGLEVHAGHGLDYDTARKLAGVPDFVEFNIGHFLIGEAIFVGLETAIAVMRRAMDEGRAA